jgi:EAL domain-containing protein (putative c-di-GMP-specific phosphodiesterase class I)
LLLGRTCSAHLDDLAGVMSGHSPPEPAHALTGHRRAQCAHCGAAAPTREDVELGRELPIALAASEIRLLYQGVWARDGRLAAFEALSRWNHPLHGPVPPMRFVPAAEHVGTIASLTDWLVAQATHDARLWPQSWPDVPRLLVNVSGSDLQRHGLADLVLGHCRDTGLAPQRLGVEITESVALADLDLARANLERLAAEGVGVALDDFGSGYSALAQVTKLPITMVKLSAELTEDLAVDPRVHHLVGQLITTLQELGLEVVAEGVDDPARLRALFELGCDYLQGLLLAEPQPAGDIVQLPGRLTVEAA